MAKKFDLKLKGYVGGYDFDSNYVEYILEKSESKEVNVLIDSLGGSVASAFSICEAFRRHGNVKVHYVGMNASAATIASLGAKHISIATSGMYLVHKCSTVIAKWASLNADQLRQLIEEYDKQKKDMEKIDLNIAAMYADKCKKDKQALLDLMKVGGWLTAQEALDWGFVDEICNLPGDVTPKVTAQVIEDLSEAGIPLPFSVQEKRLSRGQDILSVRFFFPLQYSTSTIYCNNEQKIPIDYRVSRDRGNRRERREIPSFRRSHAKTGFPSPRDGFEN